MLQSIALIVRSPLMCTGCLYLAGPHAASSGYRPVCHAFISVSQGSVVRQVFIQAHAVCLLSLRGFLGLNQKQGCSEARRTPLLWRPAPPSAASLLPLPLPGRRCYMTQTEALLLGRRCSVNTFHLSAICSCTVRVRQHSTADPSHWPCSCGCCPGHAGHSCG